VHLQVTQVRRGTKTYEYARLVKSFRGKNGTPTQKVLMNLGRLSHVEIAGIRLILQAQREGKKVVLTEQIPDLVTALETEANLTYLPIAVALDTWRTMGLDTLLARLLPRKRDEANPADVIFSLVAQRLVDPGSKSYAARWFPKTALPELTGITVEQFNNSRIHRDLEALDRATAELQDTLPHLLRSRIGKPRALFLDVSDAYFEGRGCDLAQRHRTKEGLYKKKVGVVLLCSEQGVPLRWQLVAGKRSDHHVMGEMVDEIADCSWVGNAPLVCDRSMGHSTTLDQLLRSGVRFLTAVPRHEIATHEAERIAAPADQRTEPAYDRSIPHDLFASFEPISDTEPHADDVIDVQATRKIFEEDVARARELADQTELEKVADDLYVLDLGKATRPLGDREHPWIRPDDPDPTALRGAASMVAWARIFQRALDAGWVANRAELARHLGVTKSRITSIMNLCSLDHDVQEAILAGDYGAISEHAIRGICKLSSADAQRAALAKLLREAPEAKAHPMRPRVLTSTQTRSLRRVVYFNPEMLVSQRQADRRRRRELEAFVLKLNDELRHPLSRRDPDRIRFLMLQKLSDLSLLRLFHFDIETQPLGTTGRTCYQIRLALQDDHWRARRRYHGFVLLVGHGDLPHSANDLALLYRQKDAVERDFRSIKDFIELRPIYHHTDPKVRAHLSVCVLALLLQRLLESRLRAAGNTITVPRCFEILGDCRLNHYVHSDLLDFPYAVNRPSQAQRSILKSLALTHLAANKDLPARLTPR